MKIEREREGGERKRHTGRKSLDEDREREGGERKRNTGRKSIDDDDR